MSPTNQRRNKRKIEKNAKCAEQLLIRMERKGWATASQADTYRSLARRGGMTTEQIDASLVSISIGEKPRSVRMSEVTA